MPSASHHIARKHRDHDRNTRETTTRCVVGENDTASIDTIDDGRRRVGSWGMSHGVFAQLGGFRGRAKAADFPPSLITQSAESEDKRGGKHGDGGSAAAVAAILFSSENVGGGRQISFVRRQLQDTDLHENEKKKKKLFCPLGAPSSGLRSSRSLITGDLQFFAAIDIFARAKDSNAKRLLSALTKRRGC